MDTNIVQEVIYVLTAVFSYFMWQTYKDKDYLWFTLLGGAAATINVLDYLITSIFQLTLQIQLISILVFTIFWVGFIAIVIKILLTSLRK